MKIEKSTCRKLFAASLLLMAGCSTMDGGLDREVLRNVASALEASYDKAIGKAVPTADSSVLARYVLEPGCLNGLNGTLGAGNAVAHILRFSGAYLVEVRNAGLRMSRWLLLGRGAVNAGRWQWLDLHTDEWVDVGSGSNLRYVLVRSNPAENPPWLFDTETGNRVTPPNGFKILFQAGNHVFLLENERSGGLFSWNPDDGQDLREWRYRLVDARSRAAFFLAISLEDGKRYAFGNGLVRIPESAGATAVSCRIENGTQAYDVWKADGSCIHWLRP